MNLILGHKQLNDMIMKTNKRCFIIAAMLIAAVSCAKQEEMNPQVNDSNEGTYEYILNVTNESDTKTTMDGLDILWNKEDKIGVACSSDEGFHNAKASGGAHAIDNSESYTSSRSAAFKLILPEGYRARVAAYPYDDKTAYTKGNSTDNVDAVSVVIPQEQIGIMGNIPDKSIAMVGKIETDGQCLLYNVGAVVKFEITNSNITSLRFEGNNSEVIAGLRWYYANNGNGKKAGNVIATKDNEVEKYTAKHVTLRPSGEVFEPGDYYFVVAQNTLENGFTITLTNSEGVSAVRKTDKPFTIERNHKYTKFGSDEGWYCDVRTGVAGSLGSASGTTATLYGIAPAAVNENDVPGFQISTDGSNWSDVEGQVVKRYSTEPLVNTFICDVANLTPETTYTTSRYEI